MAAEEPVYSDLRSDDVDEVSAWIGQDRWSNEIIQLSPGRLRFREQMVRFPGWWMSLMEFGQTVLFRERKASEGLSVGLIAAASRAPRLEGVEASKRDFVMRPGHAEGEYVLPAGTRTVNIEIDAAFVGGCEVERGVVAIPGVSRQRSALIAACRTLADCTRPGGPEGGEAPHAKRRTTDAAAHSVVDALRGLVAAHARGRPPARGREQMALVSRATARLEESDGALRIPQLARELAVSERTLHRVFQTCLGVGPAEFEQLRRLHAFRSGLRSRGPGHGHIAEAASEVGFGHLGRLSALYRRHFGELPSQTLRS
ncbi:MAG: helix-turn-helix domain-containing protein [Myxococcota bacterium]|nr:helix-turn-helix domain-containing protein [Myxococcota bacterium]